MEPFVWVTLFETPSLPLAPMPAGHSTAVLAPTLDFHSGLTLDRYVVKMNVVPDPSERCTTTIAFEGSLAFGLSFLIAGSSHLVILPRKISANVGPSRMRSPAPTPSRLTTGT